MVWGISSLSSAAGVEVRAGPSAGSEDTKAAPVAPEREAELRASATAQHVEATASQQPDAFERADQAYREYLGLGPGTDGAYEMQYQHGALLREYADLLHASEDPETRARGVELFRSAHDAFVQVLEMSATGTRHAEAAHAQMVTLRSHLEYAQTGTTRSGCTLNTEGVCIYRGKATRPKKRGAPVHSSATLAAKPYTDRQTMMFEAYARFEEHADVARDYPAEVPKILYHRARMMVEHNRFADARPLLERLIEEHDGTASSAWGATMLIDVLTVAWVSAEGDRDEAGEELEAWARRMLSMKLWRHAESRRLREQVPTLLAGIGWNRAEACMEAARQSPAPEDHVECGTQWVALYNEFEDHDRADVLLFNAARCFDAGYQLGNATRVRRALLDRYPDSHLAQRTLHELASSYHATAFYAQAAEGYERYAQTYPKDERSADALRTATAFRLGLGQPALALENLQRYEALYRAKDPTRAAEISWTRDSILEDPEDRLRNAEAYIRTYGTKGERDRLVVAHATAGQLLWRMSCTKGGTGDACVSITPGSVTGDRKTRPRAGRRTRPAAQPVRTCSEAMVGVVTVHRRDATLAVAAHEHFARALANAKVSDIEIPKFDTARLAAFHDAVGMSMVYEIDARYEEFLRADGPKGGDVPDVHALVDALSDDYARVNDSGSVHWITASMSRTAVLRQRLADQHRPRIPRDLDTPAERASYCATASERSRLLREAATDALRRCVDRSVELQHFSEFSRSCEADLQRIDPEGYPAVHEFVGARGHTRARMVSDGVQMEP